MGSKKTLNKSKNSGRIYLEKLLQHFYRSTVGFSGLALGIKMSHVPRLLLHGVCYTPRVEVDYCLCSTFPNRFFLWRLTSSTIPDSYSFNDLQAYMSHLNVTNTRELSSFQRPLKVIFLQTPPKSDLHGRSPAVWNHFLYNFHWNLRAPSPINDRLFFNC